MSQRSEELVVAQLGARMHYAVPRMLHDADRLSRFFTDLPPALRRRTQGLPGNKMVSFPFFGLQYAWRRRTATSRTALFKTHLWAGSAFCRRIVKVLPEEAWGVYAFNSAGLELFESARQRGMKCILEQTIAPKSTEARLLSEERDRFPGWEPDFEDSQVEAVFAARERAEWDLADIILCGSEFVAEAIRKESGRPRNVVVVPYGVDADGISLSRRPHQPGQLRVLFGGAVNLRKGVGDLAEALAILNASAVSARAVGSIGISPDAALKISASLELLGRVSSEVLRQEYANADVFVLPSICEGSAAIIYEALAAGLPVITTPNSGSVVRDGVDGFVVPIRSPELLADRLNRFLDNPALLLEMSEHALSRAREFTVSRYRQRLLEALSSLEPGGAHDQ